MWIIESKYGQSDYFLSLEKELRSLINNEPNQIANLANVCSWIYHSYPHLNWCGFYLWSNQDQELILGPFQGLPACIRIKPNKGVCGQAFTSGEMQVVNDVHEFKGHIACDSKTNSELVIPIMKQGQKIGVFDLDSPIKNRFDYDEAKKLEKIIKDLSEIIF